MKTNRTILHCDLNSFYASAECMLHPELHGKPVAVCGATEERHGIVLAKNELAKAQGVKTAEVIWQAKAKCPNLVVVQPHPDAYVRYSKLAREIYSRYTNNVEPFGMDECWLDITGTTHLFGAPEHVAHDIRRTVKRELGLTISVGVSFNKVFAKLGSDMKKPDAVTLLPYETFRETVWPLDVGLMLGVGPATQKTLHMLGIRTIGELAAAPERILRAKLGKNGALLIAHANGQDHAPVMPLSYQSPIKSVGHGITTRADLTCDAEVSAVMLSLVQRIGHRLCKHEKRAGGISIFIRDDALHTQQWQCKLAHPTSSPSLLAKTAFALFQSSYGWQHPVRSVTVRAIDLIDANTPVQIGLFADMRTIEKKERLDACVESIRNRFGTSSIQNGTLLQNIKLPHTLEAPITLPGNPTLTAPQ